MKPNYLKQTWLWKRRSMKRTRQYRKYLKLRRQYWLRDKTGLIK